MCYGILFNFEYDASYIGEEMIWQMNPQYMIYMNMIQNGVYPVKENKTKTVQKTWGYEIWFANTELYCGKLLLVHQNEWSSKGKFHYHNIKDETFFIIEGALTLDIAKENGEYERMTLYTNDSYRVMPGVKHRFTSALPIPCKFIEASTHHDDEDSYRCYYNKEKGEWIND